MVIIASIDEYCNSILQQIQYSVHGKLCGEIERGSLQSYTALCLCQRLFHIISAGKFTQAKRALGLNSSMYGGQLNKYSRGVVSRHTNSPSGNPSIRLSSCLTLFEGLR